MVKDPQVARHSVSLPVISHALRSDREHQGDNAGEEAGLDDIQYHACRCGGHEPYHGRSPPVIRDSPFDTTYRFRLGRATGDDQQEMINYPLVVPVDISETGESRNRRYSTILVSARTARSGVGYETTW